ncbi:ABC transporter permease subunit [Christensenellaceae bacterium OttesenSCG-928-K19]|nr:ABC transporter permease subunit [Christensenellaceae bacterium OttesenSCG-928-K19]
MKKLLRNPLFIAGFAIAVFYLFVAVFEPVLMPNDPLQTDIFNTLSPPSAQYPLGTDDLGRCVLSRLIAGTRSTLGATLLIELIIASVGVTIGVVAGFFGGGADLVSVGAIDIFLAFPSLILALVVAGFLGPGMQNLILAMSMVYWVEYARVTRSIVKSLREKEFVTAARALGSSSFTIIRKHILPNALPQIMIYATLNISTVIISISAMSFIGLGAAAPAAEWGSMLSDARAYINTNPQIMISIIIAIVLAVACFQMLGEAMRDRLSPRHTQLGVVNKKLRKKHAASQ